MWSDHQSHVTIGDHSDGGDCDYIQFSHLCSYEIFLSAIKHKWGKVAVVKDEWIRTITKYGHRVPRTDKVHFPTQRH